MSEYDPREAYDLSMEELHNAPPHSCQYCEAVNTVKRDCDKCGQQICAACSVYLTSNTEGVTVIITVVCKDCDANRAKEMIGEIRDSLHLRERSGAGGHMKG